MLKKLTAEGYSMWINPSFIIYITPTGDNQCSMITSNGQNFILPNSADDVVESLQGEEADYWKRGEKEDDY